MTLATLAAPAPARLRLAAVAGFVLLVSSLVVALVWPKDPELGALVGIVSPVCFAIVVFVGTRRVAIALVLVGVSLAALNGLVVHPDGGRIDSDGMLVVTLGDGVLVAGGVLLIPSFRPGPHWRYAAPLYTVIALIAAGGLVGTIWASPDAHRSLLNIAQFAAAAAGMVTLIVLWSPSPREIRLVIAIFTATVLANAGYAFLRDVTFSGRLIGLALQPNHLALMCVFATGTALAQRAISGRRAGWAIMVVVASLELIILYTGSRAGLLGFIAVVAIFAALWKPVTALTPAAVLAAFGAATRVEWLNIPETNALSRFLRGGNTLQPLVEAPFADREDVFAAGWQAVVDSPLFGHGFHDILDPHSVYLELWGSAGLLGIAGALLFAAIVGAWLWRGFSLFRSPQLPQATLLFGLAAGTAGYLVFGVIQPYLWERYIWLLPALAVATLPHLRGAPAPALRGEHQ